MITKAIIIEDLHFENESWRKELHFWEDELKCFMHRLEELASRSTDRRLLVELEQYQNQFIIHQNALNEFIEQISAHERNIAETLKTSYEPEGVSLYNMHKAFREKMDTERKLFHALKKRFFRFLEKYM